MIRIHVLLLASLLSIWGLTSCENSDTDKVNSYNLEVNLSQNEITAFVVTFTPVTTIAADRSKERAFFIPFVNFISFPP